MALRDGIFIVLILKANNYPPKNRDRTLFACLLGNQLVERTINAFYLHTLTSDERSICRVQYILYTLYVLNISIGYVNA